MTSPNGASPEGAHRRGSGFGSGDTPESAQQAMTTPTREKWEQAQARWGERRAVDASALDAIAGAGSGVRQRLALLADIDGYANAFMSRNWNVDANRTVQLPFDRVNGPVTKADVDGDSGRLVLKADGLWRVDAQVTVSGYTQNQTIYPIITPPYFTVVTTYDPIVPQLRLVVTNAAGDVLTSRRADTLPNVAIYGAGGFQLLNHRSSIAFQHTFVLDAVTADDPASWAYVQLYYRYEPINAGHFSFASCKVDGGTMRSALVAARWSRDTEHNLYAPTVPDGGTLE
ncbi:MULTISPECIES: hypothetical protein [unclassified Nocardia]|uniref:hypothetical protein n=1 Tax=unclassified Nocardia TaxID=2637762 RepID=UPI00278BC742|nr:MULTISPECIES: hypothetical protein [unclassified Nocardia]